MNEYHGPSSAERINLFMPYPRREGILGLQLDKRKMRSQLPTWPPPIWWDGPSSGTTAQHGYPLRRSTTKHLPICHPRLSSDGYMDARAQMHLRDLISDLASEVQPSKLANS